ncbi:hypothetical protein PJI16_03080 [Nitrospira sp. MA-1]|nr:hypothetical protein [Nitrospira sp. MA-1]
MESLVVMTSAYFIFPPFPSSTPAARAPDRTLLFLTGLFEPRELARLPFLRVRSI